MRHMQRRDCHDKVRLWHLLHEALTETTMAQPIVSSYSLLFSMLHSGGINHNIQYNFKESCNMVVNKMGQS